MAAEIIPIFTYQHNLKEASDYAYALAIENWRRAWDHSCYCSECEGRKKAASERRDTAFRWYMAVRS